jgi:phosphoribosylanthranilate isomerase
VTRIKVCGNTELEGVRAAVGLGVDLLGFIFTRSPRRVTVEQARALVAEVPESIVRVGVFIDEPTEQIAAVARACSLNAIQLYREPTPEDRALGLQLLPALRLRPGEDGGARLQPGDHPLLDTFVPDAIGGTGKTWDWSLAETLAQRYPVLVSGGLNASNVAAAIERLKPWGVDVSSGVERSPGIKDPSRLRTFVAAVRAADAASADPTNAGDPPRSV